MGVLFFDYNLKRGLCREKCVADALQLARESILKPTPERLFIINLISHPQIDILQPRPFIFYLAIRQSV